MKKQYYLILFMILLNTQHLHATASEFNLENSMKELATTDYQLRTTCIINMKKNLRFRASYIRFYFGTEIYIQKICLIKAISELGETKLYPYLLDYINDTDRDIFIEAIHALGNSRTSPYDMKLIHIAKSNNNDEALLCACIQALSNFTGDIIVDYLSEFLNDSRQIVKSAAIESLGYIGNERAVELLITTFKKDLQGNEQAILHALGDCRNSRIAQSFLLSFMEDRESSLFLDAMINLADLEPQGHTDQFIAMLNDNSPQIRKIAIYALSRIGDLQAILPLVDLLESPSSYDSRQQIRNAIEAICSIYRFEEIMEILQATDHPSIVALQLGKLGHESSVEVLEELLDNEDPINRIAAIRALSNFNLPQIDDTLASRLSESTPLEFSYELQYFVDEKKMQTDFGMIEKTLSKEYSNYKLIIFLAKLGRYEVQDSIYSILKNKTNPYRWVALTSIEEWPYQPSLAHILKQIVRKDSLPMRYYAAKVLKHIVSQDPSLVPFLHQCHVEEINPRVKAILRTDGQ